MTDAVVRARGAGWRRTLDGGVVLAPEGAEPLQLSASAESIWELLDAPRSVPELCALLAQRFEVDPEVVRPDVEATVRTLLDSGAAVEAP